MTSRYKGRSGFREIAGLYPYVVEIVVPPGGLARRLDDMHEFHRQRGIKDQRGPRRAGALPTLPPLRSLRRNSAARYCNKKAAPIAEGGTLLWLRGPASAGSVPQLIFGGVARLHYSIAGRC
jgi:hypothetical protein